MTPAEKLVKFLDEYEKAQLEAHRKLVLEDAPKNKMTIVTGELKAIANVRANLRTIFEP
jgi:hypothetical protein